MKKLIVLLLVLLMVMAMAVPAHAATPSVGVPEVPQISNIKFEIKIQLPDDFWGNWFREHPIDWGGVFKSSDHEELGRWTG